MPVLFVGFDALDDSGRGRQLLRTAVGGNLASGFGQECGVVFKVDPAGNETVL
jgi:hypothetical protein